MDKVKIKLLPGAVAPKRATEGSVGYDLYCLEDTVVFKHERKIIPTGVCIDLPKGYEAQVRPRSGFSAKGFEGHSSDLDKMYNIKVPLRYDADVLLGTIDSDYKQPIGVIVTNHEMAQFTVTKGTRIAQLVINKVETPALEVVDEITETDRGGFGSTGTK